jgi:tetratricopeptide (TPR) repeat protein
VPIVDPVSLLSQTLHLHRQYSLSCRETKRELSINAMNQNLIDKLLLDLKSSDLNIRERATSQLWRIWFWQKGKIPLEQIEESERLLAEGNVAAAASILDNLVDALPDFAEAWNRRAVLKFMNQNYDRAIADCEMVLKLNPVHFGALHGLGLCHAALGNYSAAIRAFRSALDIQPHAIENQRLILECTARLS